MGNKVVSKMAFTYEYETSSFLQCIPFPLSTYRQIMYGLYSTQRHLPPSDSTVSEDTGIEPWTVAILTLVHRRLNHSARSLRTNSPNMLNAT
jgi:hypothetical protein